MPDLDTILTSPPKKRKKNTNAKGNKAELLAKAHLEMEGYLVHRAKRIYRYTGPDSFPVMESCDVFGAFDLVAIRADSPVRLIQVTTGARFGEKLNQIQPTLKFMGDSARAEIWGWMARSPKGISRDAFRNWQFFRMRSVTLHGMSPDVEIRPDLKAIKVRVSGAGTNKVNT